MPQLCRPGWTRSEGFELPSLAQNWNVAGWPLCLGKLSYRSRRSAEYWEMFWIVGDFPELLSRAAQRLGSVASSEGCELLGEIAFRLGYPVWVKIKSTSRN